VRKKRFLISHEYREKKWGGKTLRKIFFQNTWIVLEKMLGKKFSEKSAKQSFLYLHEYRDKKWGEITRETIFTEEHE